MRKLNYTFYRMLWNFAHFLPKGKLIHLDLEINNNCNQRCVFCWHSEKNLKFELQSMPSSKVYEYIDQAYQYGIKSIKFNLRGEPLLNTNLVNYVSHASSLGFEDIMINTNGILLDSKKILELDRAGLTTCIISIDSMDQDIYQKLHGCSRICFENLIKNLYYLKALKKENKIKCNIRCNFHINELNEHEDFKTYIKDLTPLKCVIRYTQNRKGKFLSVFKKIKRKKYCPHMKKRIVITANEKFYPCCVCYDEPSDIELHSPIKDIKDIWDSYKRQYMIKNFRKKNYLKSCANCTSQDVYK